MVNSKKNTKSIIALVVLSILLIASICLAATGAWFTASNSGTQSSVDFGKVEINVTGSDVSFKNGDSTTLSGSLMPGDKVSVKVNVNNTQEEVYYVVKLAVTVTGNDSASFTGWYVKSDDKIVEASATVMPTLAKTSGKVEIDKSFDLAGTTYGNGYQNKTVSIAYEVRALQAKNITAAQAYTYLTAGTFSDTASLA